MNVVCCLLGGGVDMSCDTVWFECSIDDWLQLVSNIHVKDDLRGGITYTESWIKCVHCHKALAGYFTTQNTATPVRYAFLAAECFDCVVPKEEDVLQVGQLL